MVKANSTAPSSDSNTLIAWTDETANFWMGCQKVSAGCTHCYAETLTKNRMGLRVWGPGSKRQPVKNVYAKLRKLQRQAESGIPGVMGWPLLCFVGSLMDWAEDHEDAARIRPAMWEAIRQHPEIHFQLLTKRADRIEGLLPPDWPLPNVWLGTSVEDMRVAWRADYLREIPATVRFLSYEPALGPLDSLGLAGIDWVIYGGESGPGYRPEGTPHDPKCWARAMRDKCRAEGVAYFHKQSAAHRTEMGIEVDGEIIREFPVPRAIQKNERRQHWSGERDKQFDRGGANQGGDDPGRLGCTER